MSINERVKAVRNALNLTQKDFGQKLTLAQTYLSQIEKGDRDVTEKIQKLICLTFNVSEEWLQTGTGEMFLETDSTIVSQLSSEYGLDAFETVILKGFLKLKPEQREFLKDRIKDMLSDILDDEAAYKEFRAAYDKKHALPFAARGGDTSGLAEAAELFDSAFSAAESKENKDGM